MHKEKRYLNIACGSTFINDGVWTNIDFTSNSPSIKKADILNGMPFKDNQFDVIYSSHFIEHIPKEDVFLFLKDVYRILKPGGLFRVISPDLEFLSLEYISQYKNKNYLKANFITSLILDQCVRTRSGGQLQKDLESIHASNNDEMISYVKALVGADTFKEIELGRESFFNKVLRKIKQDPKFLLNIIFMLWVMVVSAFLPKSFKNLNISNVSLGEKHQWLYDFNSLFEALNEAKFVTIDRVEFNKTNYHNYIFENLDESNGFPRKGTHQLFIEAIKKL